MVYFNDLSNKRFGRLLVVWMASERAKNGKIRWHCVCDCGNEKTANVSDLTMRRTTSCGCLQSEKTAEANAARAKHGHARKAGENKRLTTPEYRSWKAMLERCKNPNAPNYHLYGGRGIKVCNRWKGRDGFSNFLSDMGERQEGTSLDRINTNGDYTPANCRWSDAKGQSNNRRNTPALMAAREKNLKGGRKHWPRRSK